MDDVELIECRSTREAEDLLAHCLEDGEVVPGPHFRRELCNEQVSIEDAWIVLRSGHIYDQPEQDLRTGEWKYRVEGPEPGGKWMAIVFSFKAINRAFLITIFSVKARSRKGRPR